MKLARLRTAATTESYWHVQLAVMAAIGLQLLLQLPHATQAKYYVAGSELLLFVGLSIAVSQNKQTARRLRRGLAFLLLVLVSVANIISLGLVIDALFNGSALNGRQLLISGLSIYLTNIIVFGLWYWELDTPTASDERAKTALPTDFLFPQMTSGHSGWKPTFFDYLYLSVTNASAFSPTDTLPLTHRAKLLMTLQSLTSLVTVALVAARAVNILG